MSALSRIKRRIEPILIENPCLEVSSLKRIFVKARKNKIRTKLKTIRRTTPILSSPGVFSSSSNRKPAAQTITNEAKLK